MTKASELSKLQRVCRTISDKKSLDDDDVHQLTSTFGERITKAQKAVTDNRVKKYVFKPSHRTVWIVVGKGRDYLIMPVADFCTCDDFYFRVMDQQVHLCYHLIAQKLAEASGCYDSYEEDDELYETLMREWERAIA